MRVSSRMLQDGSRMAQDGLKDHPGDFPGCMWVSSLQDGSRMAQDGFKDHPGDFPGCGVCEFQDAPGWVQGWPRVALRIILGFCA